MWIFVAAFGGLSPLVFPRVGSFALGIVFVRGTVILADMCKRLV